MALASVDALTQQTQTRMPRRWLPEGKAAERAFLWVFGLALVLRLAALAVMGNGPFLVSDESDYVDAARVMLSGVHFIPYWSPGLPMYLMPLVAAGASNLVLRASMLLFWLILCWAIVRLCRSAGVANFAWMILLVFAIMPDSIQLSIEVQTEQVVAALLLLAVSAAMRCAQGAGLGEYALLGCSAGAMALVRPSAVPVVFLLPLGALLIARGKAWPRRLAGPVLAMALGGALIFGWVMRAHQLCGAWIINTSNAVNLYYGNNPWTPMYRTWYFGSHAKLDDPAILDFPEYREIIQQAYSLPGGLTGLEANKYFQKLAVAEIVHHPARFVERDLNRVRCYFGFDDFTAANMHAFGGTAAQLFPVALVLEALAYLAIAAPAFFFLAVVPAGFWRRGEVWLLLGTFLVYAGPYWLSKSHPTYHFPVLALMAVLGAMAWTDTQGRRVTKWHGWAALAVLAAIQVEWVIQMANSLQSS